MVDAVCTKSFQCFPTGSQQVYGSLADCRTTVEAASCTPGQTACPGGTNFNSGNASRCVEDYKNESCDDLVNGNIPPSCSQTCTP